MPNYNVGVAYIYRACGAHFSVLFGGCEERKMSDTSSVVSFLSDPSTLLALSAVAVGAAWYLSRSAPGVKSVIPLDNQSLEVPSSGLSRTSHLAKEGLISYLDKDVRTLYDIFQNGKKVSGDGPCLGWRPGQDKPYKWITYGEVERRAVEFGAGLSFLGVEPGQENMVGIYSQNNVEWVVTEQSCNCYSRVIVPLYDTLGPEAVSYIINLASITTVVCQSVKVSLLLQQAKTIPVLKTIISMGTEFPEEEKKLAAGVGISLYTFTEVMKLGRENPVDIVKPSSEDLSTLCFTSGTTGNPKGVCLTHGNVVANVSGLTLSIGDGFMSPSDCHISYLPLAHMMERCAQALLFMHGAQVGFFQGDVKKLVGDIQELKPTIFMSVPRLLNRLYDKVITGVSGSAVKKWLFERAMAGKCSEVKQGIVRRNSVWDYLVFRRVQQSLGGRVRIVVTGSAPISEKVMTFLRCSLGCHVFEGYGQTECTAGCTVTVGGDATTGHVGPPLPCNFIKLVDVEEMNYYASNGEGEVCVKGPNVFKGYYKNPEKTEEALDGDGWLHSGDIGRWLPNGTLKITDRKKNIFKLSQGEYVAPEKVENVYVRCPFVAQAYLYGDSLKSACVALIIPDEEVLIPYAKERNIPGTFQELCCNETIRETILKDITALGKEAGLHSFEQAKALALHHEPFSVENGFLTPTFKAKRPVVKTAFMETFVRLYHELSH